MTSRPLSSGMASLFARLRLGVAVVTGVALIAARALRARGLATRVRRLVAELSLNGNPLRRERWRLTKRGERAAAELPCASAAPPSGARAREAAPTPRAERSGGSR